MAINSDTEINLALLQLGKNANRYRLNQSLPPHEIIEWDSGNKDSQPTDDELNAAYIQWKNAEEYKENRVVGTATTSGYDLVTNQLDQLYHDMKDGKLGVAATTGSWYVGITSVKNAFPKPS